VPAVTPVVVLNPVVVQLPSAIVHPSREFSQEFNKVWDCAMEMPKPSTPIIVRIFLFKGFFIGSFEVMVFCF
jgi:hypothetical protein